MTKWPKDNQAALIAFYGDPGAGETARQLVKIKPPFEMYYDGKLLNTLSFHKKAAPALLSALTKVWDYYDHDQKVIDKLGISKTAGTFNPRKIRGSATKWSNHAYGAAIDINAEQNGFNVVGNIPAVMIAAFKSEGAAWGGNYRGRPDPMHFEFCDRGEPKRSFEKWLEVLGVKPRPLARTAAAPIPEPDFAARTPAPTDAPDRVVEDFATLQARSSSTTGSSSRFTAIYATEFGSTGDHQSSAYGGDVDPESMEASLPARVPAALRYIRVHHKGKSVVCRINDVGPWNTKDTYWTTGKRPAAESQYDRKTKAQNGRVPSNRAGIDLTPAVMDALGVPGVKGKRSALVDWEFASALAPAPVATEPSPEEAVVRGDRELWDVQRRLKAMNYNPGGLDGIWGGMTSGAISGFINDREADIVAPTSADDFANVLDELKAKIAEAETQRFTRPVAPERAEATPEQIAPRVPEVQASITAERLGFWGSISAAITTAVTGVSKFFGDAVEWLNPIKEFIGDLPWPVWVAGALTISASLYYISRKSGDAKNAATKAFQEGSRV